MYYLLSVFIVGSMGFPRGVVYLVLKCIKRNAFLILNYLTFEKVQVTPGYVYGAKMQK